MSGLTRTRRTTAAIAAAYAILAGCGGGGDDSTKEATSTPGPITPPAAAGRFGITLSDLEIAALVYSDLQRMPAGMDQQSAGPGQGYVTTVHLKNSDIAPAPLAADEARFELCTDDWNAALEWSEQAASRAGVYADLVATNTDPRYFEFVRVAPATPDHSIRARVYRCAYLDRHTVDLRSPLGAAGFLNKAAPSGEDLRQLTEYLWQFTVYNNYGNATLGSAAAGTPGTLRHALQIAHLTRADDPAACDAMDVIAWEHTLDRQTGELTLNETVLWTIRARYTAGHTEIC